MTHNVSLNPFKLNPLKTAAVSEISELTATADIPSAGKVNFHIGNPLQDQGLISHYFKLCTGLTESEIETSNEYDEHQKIIFTFIRQAINNAVPYLPRGGYTINKKPVLINHIQDWLSQQEEPLYYSFGDESQRECILVSGGVYEFLRCLFNVLAKFTQKQPVTVLPISFNIPDHLKNMQGLIFKESLEINSSKLLSTELQTIDKQNPTLILLGKILNENERRILRRLMEKSSVLVCELSDTFNQQSMARESGLKDNVIRFLSPAIFDTDLKNSALQFVLGNSEILKLLEAVHFELKGTPSATELSLLEYNLEYKSDLESDTMSAETPVDDKDNAFLSRMNIQIDRSVQNYQSVVDDLHSKWEVSTEKLIQRTTKSLANYKKYGFNFYNDSLETLSVLEAFTFVNKKSEHIQDALKNHFCKHHPQYDQNDCIIVSGSSRTALSLLGMHCGIKEIATFDLSWSYENAFSKVLSVPLLIENDLNVAGLLELVNKQIKNSPGWKDSSAVIINNPHNASGSVFNTSRITELIKILLDNDIYLIDDLCYQDVAPTSKHVKIKTLKEIALETVKAGYLQAGKLDRLLTFHSLSKTDCFAGARLTVAEIPTRTLKPIFKNLVKTIQPNQLALFLAYLFYRNDSAALQNYWHKRNSIFEERALAITDALKELPDERNPFQIHIDLAQGSMYPHLTIRNFPKGISIDSLANRLAQNGIGLVPLTAFSKTMEGFEYARKTFRLTLGGPDDAELLKSKSRRLFIELNRLLKSENRDYQKFELPKSPDVPINPYLEPALLQWYNIRNEIKQNASKLLLTNALKIKKHESLKRFNENYLPWRISILNQRFYDLLKVYSSIIKSIQNNSADKINHLLSKELYKETISERQIKFKNRLFDRTVHPTQMYSLKLDTLVDDLFHKLIFIGGKENGNGQDIAQEIVNEFLGLNIPINSEQEAHELIFDLKSVVLSELFSGENYLQLLSFWGDWDGSTRPSGQGHRLIAAVLIENVKQMAFFLEALQRIDKNAAIEKELLFELKNLPKRIKKFWDLLNNITKLTGQLEKRYKGLLPVDFQNSRFRKITINLKLSRDPLSVLFSHNNRLEKKMLQLRQNRKITLEYYFDLNKKLRKKLHSLIPLIIENIKNPEVALIAGTYRNILKRFALTPRIHQRTITSDDPFTIENTVHNLSEINEIGNRFGNPGLILGLQVSMSTHAEALIELNRMVQRKTKAINKNYPDSPITALWLIPLFEDKDTLDLLEDYLQKLWFYAEESRMIHQTVRARFQEITCEIFVAGSDLSQQIGQAKSWELFKQTKVTFYKWLAERGLIDSIRIKLGCGEPQQRQAGYYSHISGKDFFYSEVRQHLKKNMSVLATQKMLYARSPLKGLQLRRDLLTIQSNAAEHILRFLSLEERTQLFFHMSTLQKSYREDLIRIGKMFNQTRLIIKDKALKELERVNSVSSDPVYHDFLETLTANFRQILYGKDKDIVGIHVISYFISRMVPALRDRPTVRPTREASNLAGQKIVERIAQTLPLSRHGSLLRAIGHNRSQSMILGINQLTTGLFRSLKMVIDELHIPQNINRIISKLQVNEILNSLRLFQQTDLKHIKYLESSFNPDNSSLQALYEDMEYINMFIPLLQKELLLKQGLASEDFFENDKFKIDYLSFIRPDLAVLLQPDLFNTDVEQVLSKMSVKPEKEWTKEFTRIIIIPAQLKEWRDKIWQLIGQNIYQQVESFIDLAKALATLSEKNPTGEATINFNQPRSNRLVNQINTLLRGTADDSMRQFLYSAVEYISHLPASTTHLPIDTIRALRDIERIIKIDEQLLSEYEQSKLRYYILQMARLSAENG